MGFSTFFFHEKEVSSIIAVSWQASAMSPEKAELAAAAVPQGRSSSETPADHVENSAISVLCETGSSQPEIGCTSQGQCLKSKGRPDSTQEQIAWVPHHKAESQNATFRQIFLSCSKVSTSSSWVLGISHTCISSLTSTANTNELNWSFSRNNSLAENFSVVSVVGKKIPTLIIFCKNKTTSRFDLKVAFYNYFPDKL